MRSDKLQGLSNLTTRQKITAGALVIIIIIIIWQIVGLFRGGSAPTVPATPSPAEGAAATPQFMTPKPAQLPKQEATSQREMELIKLQQETQAKYLAALNELQMLKLAREIAETTQAISTAKLATVTAQKKIVDLLVAPEPQIASTDYAKGLVTPVTSGATVKTTTTSVQTATLAPEVNYTAISVAQLQNKWNAILGYQGTLYNVMVGDVLPPDGSKVVSIDKTGVILEKGGAKKKVSLVPMI